jgi:hypothetical protein
MADETTDVSTKEQMCILLRFADMRGVREEFIGFVEVTDTTGELLANTLFVGTHNGNWVRSK